MTARRKAAADVDPPAAGAAERRLARVLDRVEDILAWAHATANISTDKEAEAYRDVTGRLEAVVYGELQIRRAERRRAGPAPS